MQREDIEKIAKKYGMTMIVIKDVDPGGIPFHQIFIADNKRRISLGRMSKLHEMTEQQLDEMIAAKLS